MHFFFAYYPYICITLLLAGLAFRYVTDPGDWNARSSEIFEKTWLRRGSIIFHYAIILSFFGHIVGPCPGSTPSREAFGASLGGERVSGEEEETFLSVGLARAVSLSPPFLPKVSG